MVLLQKNHIEEYSKEYDLPPAIIDTVAKVESAGSGYYLSAGLFLGELKVLFEGHYFHRLTKAIYAKKRPDLSYQVWTTKNYRKGQNEFQRFLEAFFIEKKKEDLDLIREVGERNGTFGDYLQVATMSKTQDAALRSASWGKFQVMGENFSKCGYKSASEMIIDYYKGEDKQLAGFLNFCENTKKGEYDLIQLLKLYIAGSRPALNSFVEKYNGKGQIVKYSAMIDNQYKKSKLLF